MNIVLPTPQGGILINMTKVNAVDLREDLIVVLFTSEKSSNLSFTYEDSSVAKKAFDCFTNSIQLLNQ